MSTLIGDLEDRCVLVGRCVETPEEGFDWRMGCHGMTRASVRRFRWFTGINAVAVMAIETAVITRFLTMDAWLAGGEHRIRLSVLIRECKSFDAVQRMRSFLSDPIWIKLEH